MEFEFDPAKDKLNQVNHGLSLSMAKDMAWDEALAWVDDRFEYEEVRMVALVPMGDTLHYIAYVDPSAEKRRVISLRKAEKKEVLHYVKNFS
jgi:uncharacterized protein